MTVATESEVFLKVACPCGRVNAHASPGSLLRLRCVKCGQVFETKVTSGTGGIAQT